jgi:hypothetical protein
MRLSQRPCFGVNVKAKRPAADLALTRVHVAKLLYRRTAP